MARDNPRVTPDSPAGSGIAYRPPNGDPESPGYLQARETTQFRHYSGSDQVVELRSIGAGEKLAVI